MSYPGERATLKGIVRLKTGASKVHLTTLNFEGLGTDENTIVIYGVTDLLLENSDVTNKYRGNSCMSVGNASIGVAIRPVIRRNTIHECGLSSHGNKDHGIYAHSSIDGRITENVFWGVTGYSIQLYPNTQSMIVSHNVFDGGSPSIRGGVVFGGDTNYRSNNNIVEFNVIAYATDFNIRASFGGTVGTGNIARNNCVFGGGLGDIWATDGFTSQSNVVADPQFVNRPGRDYRLKAGSACLAVVGYDTAALL